MAASRNAEKEMKRTAAMCAEFEAKQADLRAQWGKEVDAPVNWAEVEKTAELEAPFEEFPIVRKKKGDERDEVKLHDLREYLALTCRELFDKCGGERFAWAIDGMEFEDPPPQGCGSGQILAHFSYLGC